MMSLECVASAEVAGEVILGDVDLADTGSSVVEELPRRAETWKATDVRRHWLLRSHCEYLLFPCQYPSLRLPSKLGGYLWHRHCASARPSELYKRDLIRCMTGAIRDVSVHKSQLDQIILSDLLLDLNLLDSSARQTTVERMRNFFTIQSGLLMVSLENARLERAEGIGLLLALGRGSGGSIKRLYLWWLFRPDQNPIARDDTRLGLRGIGAFKMRMTSSVCFKYALSHFSALTVLGMNYAYLANNRGDVLLSVASVQMGKLKTLQILCIEQELPDKFKAKERSGGFTIPDWTWRKAREMCPELAVHLVICCTPTYDMVIRFLSRSMPVQHFHLSTGIDLLFQQVWGVDMVIKVLVKWYSRSLEWISLHLWRNHDNLDNTLVDLLDDFPSLHGLEFTGILQNVETVQRICNKIYRNTDSDMSLLWLHVQETPSKDNSDLQKRVKELSDEYYEKFFIRDICFECSTF